MTSMGFNCILGVQIAVFFMIILTQVTKSAAAPPPIVPDIDVDADDILGLDTEYAKSILNPAGSYLSAVADEWLWPNGIIPYDIKGNFAECFQKYDPKRHKEKIEIRPASNRCRSTMGRLPEKFSGIPLMELDETKCLFGSTVHELIHTVGFVHEHTRKDRDKVVSVHMENIPKEQAHNFEIANYTDEMMTPYDVASIMHYGPFAAAKNASYPTIEAKVPPKNNEMGQRYHMSAYDIAKINRYYHCYEDDDCNDRLDNCEQLSSTDRYCETAFPMDKLYLCMRTCGMCRYLKTTEERE